MKNRSEASDLGSKRGFSIIEALVAIGVMSVAGMALTKLNVTSMKANKSNELRMELEDIKRTIASTINCDNTIGPARPSTCTGPQVLKDKLGHVINPNNKMGPWTVEAICESIGTPASNGLSIYATKKRADGNTFMIDPLQNIPWDRKHPRSALFDPSTRLCSGSFLTTGALTCPYGIGSVNFDDRTFVCASLNIPSCPAGQFYTAVANSVPVCAAPPAAPAAAAPAAAAPAVAAAAPAARVCRNFTGRATGAGNQGGASSPNQDCQNKGGTPSAEWGGVVTSVSNRYCMNPHSTNRNPAQHGDCSNRGGSGKCGCWSCQADGTECY